MANPTRPQIEAVVTKPTYSVEYYNSGWTAISDAYVLDVSGDAESAGGSNGLIFGAQATSRATIQLDSPCASIAWERLPVRVKFGFDTSDKLVRCQGVIANCDLALDSDTPVTWELSGFDEPIARTPVYSPLFYRRPASTATGASTVEDPSNGSYAAGLVNYIFWQAGGRPLAQAGSYTNALFYYECDQSLIIPEWSWAAGENAWDELGRIARACGLVIFQAADGSMKAQHALNLAGSASYTFTRAVYETLEQRGSVGELMAACRCRYFTRRLQPWQVVYEDTTPRSVSGLDDIQVTLEFSQPVYILQQSGGALPSDCITATTTEGETFTMSAAIDEFAAARIKLTITNQGNETLIISRIQIRGRPIAQVEEGQVVVGSGVPEREIADDVGVYVQSQGHARQLATLAHDLYGTVRPTRTLTGCGYDPDRYVGEAVLVTDSVNSLSAVSHRITAIRHSDTGSKMDVDVVPTSGLYQLSDVFVIGTTYSSGNTRRLSY